MMRFGSLATLPGAAIGRLLPSPFDIFRQDDNRTIGRPRMNGQSVHSNIESGDQHHGFTELKLDSATAARLFSDFLSQLSGPAASNTISLSVGPELATYLGLDWTLECSIPTDSATRNPGRFGLSKNGLFTWLTLDHCGFCSPASNQT